MKTVFKQIGRFILLAAVLAPAWSCRTLAATITHGSNSVDLDFVLIGNPGNAANSVNGYGGVNYEYMIGKYEISVNQWDAAGIGAVNGGHVWAGDQPMYTRFYEAAKFCNWLTSGNVNLGAYTLGSLPTVTAIDREGAMATYGTIFVVPTVDEFYKAAFYNADGNYYSMYATGGAAAPSHDDRPAATYGSTNPFEAVYSDGILSPNPSGPANIDNAGGLSWYGTMGQSGNLGEFQERIVTTNPAYISGGAYNTGWPNLHSNYASAPLGSSSWSQAGLRVVMLAPAVIPEPMTLGLLAAGGCLALLRRRR